MQISIDGKGRALDNIFTERLWRTIKYEEVYIYDYTSPKEARQQLFTSRPKKETVIGLKGAGNILASPSFSPARKEDFVSSGQHFFCFDKRVHHISVIDDRFLSSNKKLSAIAGKNKERKMGIFDNLLGPPNIEKLKQKRDINALLKALSHKEWAIRRDAAMALADLGDPRGVEFLIASLKDLEWSVYNGAAEALKSLDSVAVEPLVATLKKIKDRQLQMKVPSVLWQIRDARAVEALVAALKDQDNELREAVVMGLGAMKDPQVVEPLIATLKNDQASSVRRRAARGLGNISDPRVIEPLVAALSDKDGIVRAAAAVALGELGDHRAVEPLMAVLSDNERFVRETVAVALGKLGDHRAIDPLMAVLKGYDRQLQMEAAEVLGKTSDPRAVEALVAALKNQDIYVRGAAVEAMGAMKDPQVVEPLIATLKNDQASSVRRRAAVVLGETGNPRAIEPLITALSDGDDYVREAVPAVLGKLGDHRAVGPLRAALKDESSVVRAEAAMALRNIDGPEAEWGLAESKMSFNPLDILPSKVSRLIHFGLVASTTKGGTRSYKVTGDGLLYIDGMFNDRRDCAEHSNPMADLNAVSRGRVIILNGDELAVLAAIFLGEHLTSHVIDCAEKMGFERGINGTLSSLAGSLAHGVRHSKRGEQKVEAFTDQIKLTQEGMNTYQRQLAASIAGIDNENLRKLIRAAVNSWQVLNQHDWGGLA